MLGHVAFALAVVVGLVPASFAQDPRGLERCRSAGTGVEAEKKAPIHQSPRSNRGVSVEVPIGTVCVGPESMDGDAIYVRRTTVRERMTIVEVSTTPFMPVLSSNQVAGWIARPDQPAGW